MTRFCLFAWLAFLAVGLFLALMTPLGEGIDEPAHFAYVQYVAEWGQPPLALSRYFSQEVDQFLHLQPVSWSFHSLHPELQSHDEYWAQSAEERKRRDALLRALRFNESYVEIADPASVQYESHQPPLYYAVTAPVFAIASRWFSFAGVFLVTRIWSVVLASLIVPGAFLLSQVVFRDPLACNIVVSLVVLFPGLYPGVVRVSNDALAAPVAAWFFFCLIGVLQKERRPYLYGLCAMALVGLWTKAFFIPLVAAAGLILLFYRKTRPAVGLLLVSTLGWFWYGMTFMHTGSLTGLPETVQAHTTVPSSLGALGKLDWLNMLVVMRSSHIWIGNGSLLGVRSWMYGLIGWLFVLLLAGSIVRPARAMPRTIFPLIVSYAVFGAALVYFATQVFQQTGESVIQGWYMTMFIPVEAVLCIAGARAWFGKRWTWPLSFLIVLLFALLIYSAVFVALPYYAGITSHTASGHLQSYHPALTDFSVLAPRLLRFQPAVPVFLPSLLLCIVMVFFVYSMLRINRSA
jgi:hypothetical protein